MNKQELISKIKSLQDISSEEKVYLIELVNTKKKYGLVWEEKPEDVEEQLRSMLPVFKEVKERAIISEDKDAPNHILIEGDNLHALTALSYTHEGKIDVIYIDPPYNTGSKDDFIYNDHYVDKEDSFRHSKWLSFMNRRLRLAHKLLKEDGVIFCSIGDDEIAQLTLLFSDVFKEDNKLGVIARVAKTAGDKGSYFAPSKDYVIAFTKNKSVLSDFKDTVDETLFKKIEISGPKQGQKYRDDVAFYQSSLDPMRGCINQRYFVLAPDGSLLIPPGNTFPDETLEGAKIAPTSSEEKVWRWSVDTYLKQKDSLVFKQTKKSPLLDEKGNRAKWNIYTKSYLSDRSEKGASPRDYLDQFINRKGADLIKQYDIDFSYSKPYELIEHLIKITNKSNDITFLDFFAGSGTSLHAIMSLNQLDEGIRQCILVTNNENNICENVTYPRCNRLINAYVNKKGKEMVFYPFNNLRYYQSDFVPSERTEINRRLLTARSTELLCIKEDCFLDVTKDYNIKERQAKLFTNGLGKYMIVIYHSRNQEEVIAQLTELIQNLETTEKIKLYAFSPEKESIEEDFFAVADKIAAVPLPDSIYNAYRATFRTLKLNNKPAAVNSLNQDI